jgi:hypothetical protein
MGPVRRVPPAALVLLPLALSLLYAAVHPLFARTPTLGDVVPQRAVMTHRFKDLEAADRAWLRPEGSPAPSDLLGPSRNLPGLAGVDPHRPLHLVYLPPQVGYDPTMVIFPVGDRRALEDRYLDPAYFLERGHVRHAQFLEVHGDFAAISSNREAVRHLGEGGISGEALGEDVLYAADVPALVRFALIQARIDAPWREIVEALGVDVGGAERVPAGIEVPAGRILRVHDGWRTVRLWAWLSERRIRARLEPAPGRLAEALGRLVRTPPQPDLLPLPPPGAQAWLWIPDPDGRAALAHALFAAGVPFPAEVEAATLPLGAVGAEGGTGLLLWAAPSPGVGWAWTLGLAAPGSLPDLVGWLPPLPPPGAQAPLDEGAVPLTKAEPTRRGPAPAGRIARGSVAGLDVVTVGAAAAEALARVEAHALATGPAARPEPPEAGLRLVARFHLAAPRARAILGRVLAPGGLLHALGDEGIEGAIWTDGRALVVEAARAAE